MTREERQGEVKRIKSAADTPKRELETLMSELFHIGEIREANSLIAIIDKLELWQNR